MSICINKIDKYYSDKLNKYGTSPKGVDWNDLGTQELRFEQLLKVCDKNHKLSIIDLGCGYGYLYEFMKNKGYDFIYYGVDISKSMIEMAKNKYHSSDSKFICSTNKLDITSDYCVSSGIFNVKLDYSSEIWSSYILKTIHDMNNMSSKGFSFNCLTKYSDKSLMREDLYYADPCFLFDYCKKNFSKNVSLYHDYDLYEFTIIIKK